MLTMRRIEVDLHAARLAFLGEEFGVRESATRS